MKTDREDYGCGYEYDHTLVLLSESPEGRTLICTECDAEVEEKNEEPGHWTRCLSFQECNRECVYVGQACREKRNDEAITYTSE